MITIDRFPTAAVGHLAACCALGLVARAPVSLTAQEPPPPTSTTAEATWKPFVDGALPAGWTRPNAGVLRAAAEAGPLGPVDPLANFRLRLDFRASSGTGTPRLRVGDRVVDLPADGEPGQWRRVDAAWEHVEGGAPRLEVSVDGRSLVRDEVADGGGPPPSGGPEWTSTPEQAGEAFPMDGDFTVAVGFRTEAGGTLVARCAANDKWSPNAKALFIRGGRLVYDIGWVGSIRSPRKIDDGREHLAVLSVAGGTARLFIDGQPAGERAGFTAPDPDGHVFKIGRAAPDFGGEYEGAIDRVRFWKRALAEPEIRALSGEAGDAGNTPSFEWSPPPLVTRPAVADLGTPGVPVRVALEGGGPIEVRNAAVQPLDTVEHAALLAASDDEALERGKAIYHTLCVTCHGTVEQPGTLPTALRFHEGVFRNGSDPFRLYQTLAKGYGQMVPQPQYSPREKYDVIHYLRETFLRDRNPSQFTTVDEPYLASLPRGLHTLPGAGAPAPGERRLPPYERMDFGPALFWTYQVAPDNIAYKGIAVRLDEGPGGISKGRAWILYDHDTMRVAAAWTGKGFVDWRGIAFDGSHGTHTSISGDRLFVNPVGPGAARPSDGSWSDPRLRGRDDKPYGPLPRDWVHYEGLHLDGNRVVLRYTIGGAAILESPGFIDYGATPVITRAIQVGARPHDLRLRLAPTETGLSVAVTGFAAARVVDEDGFHVLHLPAGDTPARLAVLLTRADEASASAIAGAVDTDLSPLLDGGPPRWGQPVTTESTVHFDEGGGFAVDTLTVPDQDANPWSSWMRLGGFDFDPEDPNRAFVCTWMGDVWTVEGIAAEAPARLTWRRLLTGLFQPLGLKVRDGVVFVTCRDQLAELHDLNGDGEIDFVRNFNNDHQVTEHFHEFAMGLQTDADGNFYYAKSARHALPALVPHHGTLLRVSADGSRTEILANGFRAANGVCLNPDGTFIVTDQEGHWNPKNRINWVEPGGFYGNMFGYHDVTDESDDAMEPPLCWITNAFDRSPAELLWVPADAAWGPLNGSLLNLSYGYGQAYVVPHERVADGEGGTLVQGGMAALPIPRLPTGIMRGRFSPADGQLYTCGLFAWAGNQQAPGGFYRVRATGRPMHLPVGLQARQGSVTLTFTEPLDPETSADPGRFDIEAWDLRRTRNYGSQHFNQREWAVERIDLSPDRRAVTLAIPDLAPTWGMSIAFRLVDSDGQAFEGIVHNTIHRLPAD